MFADLLHSEIYCHPLYARSSPYPFGVNLNAPRYPFVIPTLIYRAFVKDWWLPLCSFFSWIGATVWRCVFGFEDNVGSHMVSHGIESSGSSIFKENWRVSSQAAQLVEENGWDASMLDDEILHVARARA
jgi:hypothetical protein